eukprot:TRINITY_DN13470_c0_g1_i1.p1 TRINITY_DN13470_c0_g1~~TRINITY_DN13470_c0_g1_i1.p1  ORF type:complete len:291 (+),score=30.06 TRINITY_DN13470_c0_g1_i1:83-874(+)
MFQDRFGTETQCNQENADEWLDDVLGRAPRRIEPKTGFESEPLIYGKEKKSKGCLGCMSTSILILNIIFFLIGGAVIGLSIAMMKDSSWNTVCTDCTNFFYFTIGLGAAVMVVSLVGIFGSKCSKLALTFYTCFMVFAIIIQVAIIIMIILLDAGEFTNHMGSLWRSSVKSDSHAVCDVQHSLACSGWDNCCTCLPTPVSSRTDCPADCSYNVNPISCKKKMQDDLHSNLPYILSAACLILALFLMCLVFSCLIRKRYRKSEY